MTAPRNSQALPAVPETSVIPFPGAERQSEPVSVHRRAMIEPGVGCFHIVYRDEHGNPLLDWECDYRVSGEERHWLRRVQQGIGDKLPSATARLTPYPTPRLLR